MSSSPRTFKTVSEYRDARNPEPSTRAACRIEDALDEVLPGSIEAALAYFDTESVSSTTTGNNPRPSGGIAQFMARGDIKHSVESPTSKSGPKVTAARPLRGALLSAKGPIERNAAGQVISVKFTGGECAEFKYNQDGSLVMFTYASLTWNYEDAGFWRSGDRQSDYRIDGLVEVLHDGSMRITRSDVTRTLKITGVRIDEHADGSRTESRKLRNAATPFDLLAKSKAVSSVWLSSQPQSFRGNEKIDSIQLLESSEGSDTEYGAMDGRSTHSMIPAAALVAEASRDGGNLRNLDAHRSARLASAVEEKAPSVKLSPPESIMLRNAVARMPETQRKFTFADYVESVTREIREFSLKSIIWFRDVIRSSPASQLQAIDALADIYSRKQQNDNAETLHLKALHIKESYYGAKQPELANNISGLAEIYCRRRNFPRAEQMYKEAVQLYEKSVRKQLFLASQNVCEQGKLAREVEALFRCFAGLAETYQLQKKNTACRDLYETAMALWTEISDRAEHRLDSVLQTMIERYIAVVQTESDPKAKAASGAVSSVS
ncbi:MAG: tetratricopeptide repeat protein [Candidatus Obscuribacterales bacterium]|nr:tetratricopeptide repeat protein [Candidatus Obscuribacterales bacterium]